MTLIFLPPTPEHPNGYLVRTSILKPRLNKFSQSPAEQQMWQNEIDEMVKEWENSFVALHVYATCSPNKWKHGQELKEGVDFEIKQEYYGQRVVKYGGIPSHVETYTTPVAVPLDKQEIKTDIENLVNEIVYNQHDQDKEIDFSKKVRIVKEWLEKYYSHWMGKSSSNALLKTEGSPEKPVINEKFTDNGEHSHWELIDVTNGTILWTEEPPAEQPEVKGEDRDNQTLSGLSPEVEYVGAQAYFNKWIRELTSTEQDYLAIMLREFHQEQVEPASHPQGEDVLHKNKNKMTKSEILGSKSTHYPDLLDGDLLNDPCITPKEAFSAMDEYGEQVSVEIKKWKGYPQGEQEDGGDELWNELGKDIYGGLSFKWYTEKLSALKAKYSLIKK